MYSYAARTRAVKLYIQLGRRTAATIRQLGYPTKNSLKSWYREYKRCHDLAVGYVRSKPRYSDEQKNVAVEHYVTHDRCIAATLKALGYPGRGWLLGLMSCIPKPGNGLLAKLRVYRAPQCCRGWQSSNCTRQGSAKAQKLGVSRPTLYNWKNRLLGREVLAAMKRPNDSPPETERAELERQLESLRRDIRHLQLEHDLLKKANEILKKDAGVDLQLLTNREKTLLVDALKETYALSDLLAELRLARSSYFYHRARLQAVDKYVEVRRTIGNIFELNHRCYGYRRIHASLSRQHIFISEKVVQRLMKQERLVVATTKQRRYGSYLGEIGPAPENLINRDFQAAAPNEKWLTDITEFQIPDGKVYLSPMIDCFDGLVISCSTTRFDANGWTRADGRSALHSIAVIDRCISD